MPHPWSRSTSSAQSAPPTSPADQLLHAVLPFAAAVDNSCEGDHLFAVEIIPERLRETAREQGQRAHVIHYQKGLPVEVLQTAEWIDKNQPWKHLTVRGDAYFALALYGRTTPLGALKEVEVKDATGAVRLETRLYKDRSATNVRALKALWADVDYGTGKQHPDQDAAMNAVLAFEQRHGLPQPWMVTSGSGLHVYWPFTDPVEPERWYQLAVKLRAIAAAEQLADDLGCTTDAARVLRVPGTHNRKRPLNGSQNYPEVTVTQIGSCTSVDDLDQILTDALAKANISLADHELNWAANNARANQAPSLRQPRPHEANAIASDLHERGPYHMAQAVKACAVLRDTLARGGAHDNYEKWRTVIKLATFADDGDEWAHRLSAKHDDYDETLVNHELETQRSYYHAGPPSCDYVSQLDGCENLCATCSWRAWQIARGVNRFSPIFTGEPGREVPTALKVPLILRANNKIEDVVDKMRQAPGVDLINDIMCRSTLAAILVEKRASTKILVIDEHGFLREYTRKDFIQYVLNGGWALVDNNKLAAWRETLEDDVDADEAINDVLKTLISVLIEWALNERQITRIQIKIDMFTNHIDVDRTIDGEAVITLPHRRFREDWGVDSKTIERVVEDFEQHFPQFSWFLMLLVMARFASTRRFAFLWMRCLSGWGKNLLKVILADLGLVLEVKPEQVEQAFSGAPIGIDLERAYRAWVLLFDEFAGVKREIKDLNDQFVGAPKHQLQITLETYLKLFFSAEGVGSLTEAGVERQFAERFSAMDLTDPAKFMRLDDRPLHRELGSMTYRWALTAHIARTLNELVDWVWAESDGNHNAADEIAQRYLTDFRNNFRIDLQHGLLDEGIEDVVDFIVETIHRVTDHRWHPHSATGARARVEFERYVHDVVVSCRHNAPTDDNDNDPNAFYISPRTAIANIADDAVPLCVTKSAVVKLRYKKDEIVEQVLSRLGTPQRHTGNLYFKDVFGKWTRKTNKKGLLIVG
jgi:hypothetical protein